MNKKITAVAIAGAILLSGCSAKYHWTRHDRQAAMVMIAGNVADGLSTAWAMRQDDLEEGNSTLFGSDPSDGTVLVVKAATIALSLAVAHVIPEHRQAILRTLGYGMIGISGVNVLRIIK